jgi:hypothetical protein
MLIRNPERSIAELHCALDEILVQLVFGEQNRTTILTAQNLRHVLERGSKGSCVVESLPHPEYELPSPTGIGLDHG